MVQFTVERVIDLPVEKAWEILADFSNVQKIHPLVATVDQKTKNDRGLNAERTCNFYDGGSATERITKWSDADRRYTINLVEGSIPVKAVAATLMALPAGEGKTKLVGEMDMTAKYGIIGKIMEVLAFKPQFGKVIGNLFSGIEHYATTGTEVQKGYNAPTPALVK